LAHYKLGECYKKTGEYNRAKETFEKLIEQYPTSELSDEARYQIALISLQVSKGASYDERSTNEAITQFSRFTKEHPDSDLVEESLKAIEMLKDRKAQKVFETAKFYEKQGNAAAAKIYYNEVIEQYGSSRWAQQALLQLTILRKESATP
jgi:outer membrane protein assembly factor BamD